MRSWQSLYQRVNDMEMIQILNRLTDLSETKSDMDTFNELMETVEITDDITLDQIIVMMDAAKRGLGFANKLRDVTTRKKHIRAVFINMNKIRAALKRLAQ